MSKNRLKELMEDDDISNLSRLLNLSTPSIIYKWLKNERGLSLNSALIIADYFECSLDYLFLRSDDFTKISSSNYKPFGAKLKEILFEKDISQYKLIKNKIVSANSLSKWFNNESIPNMDTVIKIADYLNISLDQLVGR